MYRRSRRRRSTTSYCPHASGGVPNVFSNCRRNNLLSPREWGCTGHVCRGRIINHIVPTRVGVYRGMYISQKKRDHCPHASGGVPEQWFTSRNIMELSPREWGCTEGNKKIRNSAFIVPTRVGVYRNTPGHHLP